MSYPPACMQKLYGTQISIHVYIIDVFSRQGLMHIMERLELYIHVLVSTVRHFRDALIPLTCLLISRASDATHASLNQNQVCINQKHKWISAVYSMC